jgi:hypothetical protein
MKTFFSAILLTSVSILIAFGIAKLIEFVTVTYPKNHFAILGISFFCFLTIANYFMIKNIKKYDQ